EVSRITRLLRQALVAVGVAERGVGRAAREQREPVLDLPRVRDAPVLAAHELPVLAEAVREVRPLAVHHLEGVEVVGERRRRELGLEGREDRAQARARRDVAGLVVDVELREVAEDAVARMVDLDDGARGILAEPAELREETVGALAVPPEIAAADVARI